MDFYQYYLRRMITAKDKKVGIGSCRDMAMRMFDTGPLVWSVESGACLLAALHELDAESADVLPIFEEVEQALAAEIQGIRLDLEAERQLRIQNAGCGRPKYGKHQNGRGGRK